MTRRPYGSSAITISLDIWNPDPVFHEWADYRDGRVVLKCGRRIDPDHWRTTRMRRDHAQRIGRPCSRCAKKGMAWRFRFTTSHQNWSHA